MKALARVGSSASFVALLLCLAGLSFVNAARAADDASGNTITEDDVITGMMNIDFKTRTNLDQSGDLKQGSAAIGAMDKYNFQMNVAKTTQYNGDIFRQGKLYSSILKRTKQDAKMAFSI